MISQCARHALICAVLISQFVECALVTTLLKTPFVLCAGQPADLGMHVVLVHGDDVIADSAKAGSIQNATLQYKAWLQRTWPSTN